MSNTIPARCLYRATFRNPIARRHQLQVKVRCDVEIEIYPETRQRWKARTAGTRCRFDVSGSTPEHVQKQIRELFEEQVSEWAVYDEQIGKPMPEPKPQRKPAAHIMSDNALPEQKTVRSLCGKLVHRNQIVADQNIDQWLKARRQAGFLTGAEHLITCPQCQIMVRKAEENYAKQTADA